MSFFLLRTPKALGNQGLSDKLWWRRTVPVKDNNGYQLLQAYGQTQLIQRIQSYPIYKCKYPLYLITVNKDQS